MTDAFYLKLRCNVELAGDAQLAERELRCFFQKVIPVSSDQDVFQYVAVPRDRIMSHVRSRPPYGFIGRGLRCDLPRLIRGLNFSQEIWFVEQKGTSDSVPTAPWRYVKDTPNGRVCCLIPMLAAAEFLSAMGRGNPGTDDLVRIARHLCDGGSEHDKEIITAIEKRSTSTPHVHGLHKYKAKFFPRLIRSLLVSVDGVTPSTGNGNRTLLDPFLGSGTAMVEGALLAYDSIGIDIDGLSCAISSAKLNMLTVSPSVLQEEVGNVRTAAMPLFRGARKPTRYSFPPWIERKFQRWGSPDEQRQYEDEIGSWMSMINTARNNAVRQALQIVLSDAISRKFNIRMMGTGVGRFALEIGKTSLSSIVEANLRSLIHTAHVVQTVRNAYGISIPSFRVLQDTATAMPLPAESVSVVLTSPPYLPASSGRENYLIGKSISITALGLMSAKQIENAEKQSVGSMKRNTCQPLRDLPTEVAKLYEWLKSDDLRSIKADPTVAYYRDLKNALKETYRVLLPGGVAIYVIGKESVFYRFSTREVLYRVRCDEIFKELAERAGFGIEDSLDVQLDKKNSNARPRSLDSYFESVFVLRKPN
ncbi:MAG: hypothetical protein AB1696_04135 [Planctomycetota bacterium]